MLSAQITARQTHAPRLNKAERGTLCLLINESYGRGIGVGRGLGVGVILGVEVAVGVGVSVGVGLGVGTAKAYTLLSPAT